MGIRVNKILGYALTDVVENDPRINWESGFLSLDWEIKESFTFEGLLEYEKSTNPKYPSFILSEYNKIWHSVVEHNTEYGMENVLLVMAPFEDHRRHDCAIDWHEETQKNDQTNWFIPVKYGIYPWYNSWMDKTTGERLKAPWVAEHVFELPEQYPNYVPMVPEELQLLCKYLKLFKDEKTILELRPILYCYWG